VWCGGLLWLVVSAVVYRCDLMYRLIKLHTRGCVGSQIRLAACVSIGKYVAQLALFVWGWGEWMARSKRGFGLPGDRSEMRLPCLWKECMNCSYVVSRCWLWMGFRRVIRLSIIPYLCLLFSMCCAYADCGLLLLMYLICSL